MTTLEGTDRKSANVFQSRPTKSLLYSSNVFQSGPTKILCTVSLRWHRRWPTAAPPRASHNVQISSGAGNVQISSGPPSPGAPPPPAGAPCSGTTSRGASHGSCDVGDHVAARESSESSLTVLTFSNYCATKRAGVRHCDKKKCSNSTFW